MSKVKHKLSIGRFFISFFLILFSIVVILPLLNLLARALSDPTQAFLVGGMEIIPRGFSFFHFKVILINPLLWLSLKNTYIITIAGTAISLYLTSSAAYVLSRPKLVGKKFFMYFLIFMMIMTPGMVQEYFLVKDLGLLDSLMSMILYKVVSVYYLVIFMRFYESVPSSIVESAQLDGANYFQIFTRIYFPLMRVPNITIGMFYFVRRWNEFFYSSIFLSSTKNTVLQVLLRKFVVENEQESLLGIKNIAANNLIAQLDLEAMKATTIWIALIPILIIYPIVLKYHTKGVLAGSVKG